MKETATPGSPEPYFLKGGDVGCLLLHGLTGSPAEMFHLATALHDKGYSVHAPLVAGHGQTPEALEQTTWRDWVRSAEEGYHLLKHGTREVHVMGLSMGALLALDLATRYSVSSLVMFAPAVYLRNRLARFAPLLRHFTRYSPKHPISGELTSVLWSYDRTPLACLPFLSQLARRTLRHAEEVAVPTLIIQGLKDRTVRPEGANVLFDRIRYGDKQLALYPESGHLVVADGGHDAVNARAVAFLERVRKASAAG